MANRDGLAGTRRFPSSAIQARTYARGGTRMIRTELREHIFKMLYQVEFHGAEEMQEPLRLYLDALGHATEDDKAYMQNKYGAVAGRLPEIDKLLNENTQGWKTKRMNQGRHQRGGRAGEAFWRGRQPVLRERGAGQGGPWRRRDGRLKLRSYDTKPSGGCAQAREETRRQGDRAWRDSPFFSFSRIS